MTPDLERERALVADGRDVVVSVDEVGRGAIAGPVTVGAGVWVPDCGDAPEGIRDSKLVAESKRPGLAEVSRSWLVAVVVGEASAQEVDEFGITRALGLAGARAVDALSELIESFANPVVLLDGHHDWLSPALVSRIPVVSQVKADRDCASVAAASLVAKVHRDRFMVGAHERFPVYGFDRHKGYGSAGHFEAIDSYGPCELHRLSWLRPTELPLGED